MVKEIKFLKEIKNKNIIKYVDHFKENNNPCIITKYYPVLNIAIFKNLFIF